MVKKTSQSDAQGKSGIVTLEPVILEIDLAKLPEAPKVDTKPPDAKGLTDLLKLLGSTQKKLLEELHVNLDPQGNLKKDKIAGVKDEVVKQLDDLKKKAAENEITPQSEGVLNAKDAVEIGLPLRHKTKFLLLPKEVQVEVLKEAGFKDDESAKFIDALQKEYAAPHKKFAHLLFIRAQESEGKKEDVWIASRGYEIALQFDPGNTLIRTHAAKIKLAWAKQETDPESKKTLYQDVATHISIIVLNEPEKSVIALNALQTLKKVVPELGTPEEAKKFLGKEMIAFLYKTGEGDSDSFKKAKGEVLKKLGLEKDAARLAADALIKDLEKKGGPEKSNLSQEGAARLGIPHPKTMWENQLKELEPHLATLEQYAAEGSDLKANLLDLNRVRRMYKLMGKEDKVAEVEAKIKEGSQKIREGLKVPDGERPTAQQAKDARYLARLSAAIGDDENLIKDLDTWKTLVDDASSDTIGDKARINQYGDMLKIWTKFRTKCKRMPESDKEAAMDPNAISERMRGVNARLLEVANVTIRSDFTLGVLENLSSRLIDNDETQLAVNFTADKLGQYVQAAAKSDYSLEFSGESNPIVMQLYQALRAEGIPPAAMDPDLGTEGMGKLSAEDVLQFISGRFQNSHVQAALKASKFPMPKDIKKQMETKSFSKVMGDYYTGEAIKLREAELKGKQGSTGSWAEVVKNADSAESLLAIATLFDPKNPERLDQLGNFYFMQKRFPEASSALRLAAELRAKGDPRSPDELRATLGDPKDPLAYFENLSKAQRIALDGIKKLERKNNPTVEDVEVVVKDLKAYGQWVKDAPPELMDDATRLAEQFKVYKAFADLKEVAVKIPRPLGEPVGEVEPGYENAEKDSQGRTILRYEAQSAEDKVRWDMSSVAGEINVLVEKMEKPKVDKFRDSEGALPDYDKLPEEVKQSYQLRAYISDLLTEVDQSSGKKGERFRKALEPEGLQAYLQERMQFDGILKQAEEAKGKNDVKLQRSLLLAALVHARDVGDTYKMKELVKAVESTLPPWTAENSTSVVRTTELMEVYTSLHAVLATTQLNDERSRIEKICKGTADVLLGQIEVGSGNEPQRLKALLAAREYYSSIHESGTIKSLDEGLVKMQGEVEATLNGGMCLDPKLRLECVRMLVEVDQALMGKVYEDIQKAGGDPEKLAEVRKNFEAKQLGHLKLWKTELENLKSDESIPLEVRFEQSKALLLTALSYRAFIESPTYLLKEKEGLAPLILDCQKVFRGYFLDAGLAKAYPDGDIPEGVKEELTARLDGMLIDGKYSKLHDRNLPQFIAGLSLDGIAKFGEEFEKGNDLMREANALLADPEAAKENPEGVALAYQKYEAAAQIFSQLGLTGRVEGAMQPFMKLAENSQLAPEVRAHILMTVAKHYHFAGMKEPLDGVLSKIEALDKKDGPPQVHEMAEIARAMKEMNKVIPDPDKTIAILKRLPNSPLAQALLKSVEDAKKADMDQKTLQIVQIMMMKEAQLAKRIEAGDEGKAFADRDYEDLSDEEKTALQQTYSQIVDEAQIRVANGSSANVREALLAIVKDKHNPALSKALENLKNDEMHGTRLFNFLGDVSSYNLSTNAFNQKIADFGLKTLQDSNRKRDVTAELTDIISRGSGDYKIVYQFKKEHERIMAPTAWEQVAKVLKVVGTGLQFIPSPWTIAIGTGLLLVTAEDKGDVAWAVVGAIPGFAAGKVVKAGVTAKLAVGTARGLKAMAGVEVAVQSGRAVKGFRILEGAALLGGRAEKAVQIVAVAEKGTELSLKSRVLIKAANFSVETLGTVVEAGTVAITNQLANTTYKWVRTGKWDTSHFAEHTFHEFLTMVVLFNVGRGLSPISQGAMKRTEGAFAHYAIERATGIMNFYISKKFNVAAGIEKAHEGSEWEVLKECVIGDFQMVAANYLTGRLMGKSLQKWEQQAHDARFETEMLSGFKRLGYLDTQGNLTAAGQIAMHGVRYQAAQGESPSKILKSLEKIKPADLEAHVKKMGLDPADPNAQVLMGSAISYRLVREAEYKKTKTAGDATKDLESLTDSVHQTLEKMGLTKDSPEYETYRQGLLNSMLLGGRSPQEVAKLAEQGPEIKKAMDEAGKKVFGKKANSPEAHAIFSALLNHSLESTDNVAANFSKKVSAMEKAAPQVDDVVKKMGLNPRKGQGKDFRNLLLQNAGLKEWSPEAVAALGEHAPKLKRQLEKTAREILGKGAEEDTVEVLKMHLLSQSLSSAKDPAAVPGELQRWADAFHDAVKGEGLPKAEKKKFEKLPLGLRRGLAIDALKKAQAPEHVKTLMPELAEMAFEGRKNAEKEKAGQEITDLKKAPSDEDQPAPLPKAAFHDSGEAAPGAKKKFASNEERVAAKGREPSEPGKPELAQGPATVVIQTPAGPVRVAADSNLAKVAANLGLPKAPVSPAHGELRIPLQGSQPLAISGFETMTPVSGEGQRLADVHENSDPREPRGAEPREPAKPRERDREYEDGRITGLNFETLSLEGEAANDNVPRVEVDTNNVIPIRVRNAENLAPGVAQVAVAGVAGLAIFLGLVSEAHAQPAQHPLVTEGGLEGPAPVDSQLQPGQTQGQPAVQGKGSHVATDMVVKGKKSPVHMTSEGLPDTQLPSDTPMGSKLPGANETSIILALGALFVASHKVRKWRAERKQRSEALKEAEKKEGKAEKKGTSTDSNQEGGQGKREQNWKDRFSDKLGEVVGKATLARAMIGPAGKEIRALLKAHQDDPKTQAAIRERILEQRDLKQNSVESDLEFEARKKLFGPQSNLRDAEAAIVGIRYQLKNRGVSEKSPGAKELISAVVTEVLLGKRSAKGVEKIERQIRDSDHPQKEVERLGKKFSKNAAELPEDLVGKSGDAGKDTQQSRFVQGMGDLGFRAGRWTQRTLNNIREQGLGKTMAKGAVDSAQDLAYAIRNAVAERVFAKTGLDRVMDRIAAERMVGFLEAVRYSDKFSGVKSFEELQGAESGKETPEPIAKDKSKKEASKPKEKPAHEAGEPKLDKPEAASKPIVEVKPREKPAAKSKIDSPEEAAKPAKGEAALPETKTLKERFWKEVKSRYQLAVNELSLLQNKLSPVGQAINAVLEKPYRDYQSKPAAKNAKELGELQQKVTVNLGEAKEVAGWVKYRMKEFRDRGGQVRELNDQLLQKVLLGETRIGEKFFSKLRDANGVNEIAEVLRTQLKMKAQLLAEAVVEAPSAIKEEGPTHEAAIPRERISGLIAEALSAAISNQVKIDLKSGQRTPAHEEQLTQSAQALVTELGLDPAKFGKPFADVFRLIAAPRMDRKAVNVGEKIKSSQEIQKFAGQFAELAEGVQKGVAPEILSAQAEKLASGFDLAGHAEFVQALEAFLGAKSPKPPGEGKDVATSAELEVSPMADSVPSLGNKAGEGREAWVKRTAEALTDPELGNPLRLTDLGDRSARPAEAVTLDIASSPAAKPAASVAPALEGEITILGRQTEGGAVEGEFLPVNDGQQTVSRRHAQVRRAPDGSLFLKDLNSKFGTRVWDESRRGVEPNTNGEFPLKPGYRIEVGSPEKPVFLSVTSIGKIVQEGALPAPKSPPKKPLPPPKSPPLRRVASEVREGKVASLIAEAFRLGREGDTSQGRDALNDQALGMLQNLFRETTPELTTAFGKFLETGFAAAKDSGLAPEAMKNFSAQAADLIRRTVESARNDRSDFLPLFHEARAVAKAFGFGPGHEVTLALEALLSVTSRSGRLARERTMAPEKPGRIATPEEVLEAPPPPVGRGESEVPQVFRKAAYAPQAAEEIQPLGEVSPVSQKRGAMQKLAGWLGIGGVVGLTSTAFMDSAEAAVKIGGEAALGNSSVMVCGAMAALGILGMAYTRGSRESAERKVERITPQPPQDNPFGQRTFEYRRPGANDFEFIVSFGGVVQEIQNGVPVRRPKWLLTVNPDLIAADLPFRRVVDLNDGRRIEGMGNEIFPGQELRLWDGTEFVFTPPEVDMAPRVRSPWEQPKWGEGSSAIHPPPLPPQAQQPVRPLQQEARTQEVDTANYRKAARAEAADSVEAEPQKVDSAPGAPKEGSLRKLIKLLGGVGVVGLVSTGFIDSAEAAVQVGGENAVNNPSVMAFGAIAALGILGVAFSIGKGKSENRAVEGSKSMAPEEFADLPQIPRAPRLPKEFSADQNPAETDLPFHSSHEVQPQDPRLQDTVPPPGKRGQGPAVVGREEMPTFKPPPLPPEARDQETIRPGEQKVRSLDETTEVPTRLPPAMKKAAYAKAAELSNPPDALPPSDRPSERPERGIDTTDFSLIPELAPGEELAAGNQVFQEAKNILSPYFFVNHQESPSGPGLEKLSRSRGGLESFAQEALSLMVKISSDAGSLRWNAGDPGFAKPLVARLTLQLERLKLLLEILEPAIRGEALPNKGEEIQILLNDAKQVDAAMGRKAENDKPVSEVVERPREEILSELKKLEESVAQIKWAGQRREMFERQSRGTPPERKAAGDVLQLMGEIEAYQRGLKELPEIERIDGVAERDAQEKRLLRLLDINLTKLPGKIQESRKAGKGLESKAESAEKGDATGKDSRDSGTVKPNSWYDEMKVMLHWGKGKTQEIAMRVNVATRQVAQLQKEIQECQKRLNVSELPSADKTKSMVELLLLAGELKKNLAILEPWKKAVQQIQRNGVARADFFLDRSPVDYNVPFSPRRNDNPEISARLFEDYFSGQSTPFEGNSLTLEVKNPQDRQALVEYVIQKAQQSKLIAEPQGPEDLRLKGPEGVEFYVHVKALGDSKKSKTNVEPPDQNRPTLPPTKPPSRAPSPKEKTTDEGPPSKGPTLGHGVNSLLVGLGLGLGALVIPGTALAAVEPLTSAASHGGVSGILTGLGLSFGILAMAVKNRVSRERRDESRIEVMESELPSALDKNLSKGTLLEVWLEKAPEDKGVHHLKSVAQKRGVRFEVKDLESGGTIHIEIGKDGRPQATTTDVELARHTPTEVTLVAEVEPRLPLDQQISEVADQGVKRLHVNVSAKDISPQALANSARLAAEKGVDLELSDAKNGELFLRVIQGSGGAEIKINNLEVNSADVSTRAALQQLIRSALASDCQRIQIGKGLSIIKNKNTAELGYNFSTTLPISKVEGVFGEYLGFETARLLRSDTLDAGSLARFWRGAMQHAMEMEANINMGKSEAAEKKAEYSPFSSEGSWMQRWQNSVAGMRRFAADEAKRARLEATFGLLENYSQSGEDFLGFQPFNGRALDDNAFELMRLFEKGVRSPELRLDIVLDRISSVLGPHHNVQLYGAVVGTVFKAGIPKIGKDGRDVYDFAAQNEYLHLLEMKADLKNSPGQHRVTVIPEDRLQGSNFRSPQFTKTPEWIIESFGPEGKVRSVLVVEVTQADAAKVQEKDVVATISKKVEQLTGHQFAKGGPVQQSLIAYKFYNSAGNEMALIEMTRKAVAAEAASRPAGQMDKLRVLVVFENNGHVREKSNIHSIEFKAGQWVSAA